MSSIPKEIPTVEYEYHINLPAQVSEEETLKLISEFIAKDDEYVGDVWLHSMRKGTNDDSHLFKTVFKHRLDEGVPYDSLENTIKNKIADAIWKRKEELDKESESKEPEVVEEAPAFDPSKVMGGMGGLGAMLGGLAGGKIPGLDPATQAKLAETIEEADNAYWDNHIHYNVLVEAVEDFDQAVVKRIGKLIKISSTDDFDVEVRNILSVFKGFFTIAGKTNWLAIREFLADLRLSMKNELQQFCGYKKVDKEDDKKSRDVAPHMRIAQEEIYKKIEYAFDRIELEINLIHGVLPMNTEYKSVNDPANVVEHGQTTPEERFRASAQHIRDIDSKIEVEEPAEPAVEGELID